MKQAHSSIVLFEQVAAAISAKYLAQVGMMTARLGARPSFDELMVQLKQMEQELTREGLQFIEDCKTSEAVNNEAIVSDLKDIIRRTIEGFVKQL